MTLDLAALAARLHAATITPSPSPSDVLRPGLDPYDVSPGLLGFLAIFAVAGVCVVGWMSLNRKVRRLRFEERAEQRAEAEAGPEADQAGAVQDAVKADAAQDAAAETPAAGTGGSGVSGAGVTPAQGD